MEQGNDIKYFKGKYIIVFYDKEDERVLAMFDNIHEICRYKKMDSSPNSYNLMKVELYRALRRPDHKTLMLDGTLMHVYTIDMINEEDE